MATRSRIAIENQDETVNSIYCHFDGYLSGVGETLFNHYDKEKLEKLIGLGDISSLGESTEDTVAYCRDRGEDLCSTSYLSIEGLFGLGFDSGAEYIYCLTKEGTWVFKSYGKEVSNLKEALD
jgi:hypothetical protein